MGKAILFILFNISFLNGFSQLKLGTVNGEINFREGPGMNYKIVSTIDNSNLLVILPREPQNHFIEVFDVETNSVGFVAENLIHVNNTLSSQKQQFMEKSGENVTGDIEIELVNKSTKEIFVWINKNSYKLSPYEKKELVMENEEITYFSSAPDLVPIFGKEVLKKGCTYRWSFSF